MPFYKHGITLGIPAFLILTLLVVAFTSNAVNLTDGMDGLASGCMALCSFVFMIFTFLQGDPERAAGLLLPYIPGTAELAVLCGAILGACLGFLWCNCHPAHVFMGDTGSLPLGGLIGYVAIVTRQELMLFIVGGIFVIEAVIGDDAGGLFQDDRRQANLPRRPDSSPLSPGRLDRDPDGDQVLVVIGDFRRHRPGDGETEIDV